MLGTFNAKIFVLFLMIVTIKFYDQLKTMKYSVKCIIGLLIRRLCNYEILRKISES